MKQTSIHLLWLCTVIAMQLLFTEVGGADEQAPSAPPKSVANVESNEAGPTKPKRIVPLETVLPDHLLVPGRTTTSTEPMRGSLSQLAALPPVATQPQPTPFPVMDLMIVVSFLAFAGASLALVVYAFVRGFKKNHLITVRLCASLVLVLDAASISVSTKSENYILFGLMRSPLAFSLSLAVVALATLIAIRVFGRTTQ